LGELILKESLNAKQKTPDVSGLSAGLYSVMVETSKGKVMKNLVVE
jgi:hypothetical protein